MLKDAHSSRPFLLRYAGKNFPSMAYDECGRLARSARPDAAALQELLIATVIEERRSRNLKGIGEKRQGSLCGPNLFTLNIANLISRDASQICQREVERYARGFDLGFPDSFFKVIGGIVPGFW